MTRLSNPSITTLKALRASFWEEHPKFVRHPSWKQNQYPADIRMAWCDYVENLSRSGEISNALTQRATL